MFVKIDNIKSGNGLPKSPKPFPSYVKRFSHSFYRFRYAIIFKRAQIETRLQEGVRMGVADKQQKREGCVDVKLHATRGRGPRINSLTFPLNFADLSFP